MRFVRSRRARSLVTFSVVLLAMVGVLAAVTTGPIHAQQLPTLTPADYARWETIGATELSPDGRWLAWTITRVDDDGDLRIREVGSDSTRVVPNGSRPLFSPDSRWVAYSIGIGKAERQRREQSNQSTRSQVGLLDLVSGHETVLEEFTEFEFSPDGGFIVLQGYQSRGQSRGRDVVVRDLARGIDTGFGNIAEMAWQDGGRLLAMIVDAENRAANGIRTYDPQTGIIRTLESDTATYRGLTWRKGGNDLAVLRVRTNERYSDPTHGVIAWINIGSARVTRAELDPQMQRGFPVDRRIVETRALRWSEDGNTIYLGVREWTPKDATGEDAARDTTGDGSPVADSDAAGDSSTSDPADVEVWHTGDVDIIPEQKVNAHLDHVRHWLTAWRPRTGRLDMLADSTLRDVTLSDGRFAIGIDPVPYERERMFGPEYRDLYVIDATTGERTRVAERVQFQQGISPGGRYILYMRDGDYWTYDTQSRRHTNITGAVSATFVNLENDHTISEKPPYGNGGWTTDDRSVLLYDRYDIWEVRPDGSGARRLTHGVVDQIRHRRAWLRPDHRIVDRSGPVYVTLYGERTKQFGYARVMPGDAGVERLVLMDRNVSRLTKADSADVYMYRVEAFDDSPDMFVGGPALADAVQVTETNPFQHEYAWGRAELVDYTSATGEPLQAALFYPADYDPSRTYPMIVHIYEITSNTLHGYAAPSTQTAYNATVFTQNGYFVLRPDIVYRGRDPGLSAVEAIVPAVERVLEVVPVDRKRVGLIGHSWGGYQTAFVVTQTDLFSAAVAGAPLTNLISMYLSIYWNTGVPDARIFEIDQARMEVPFWEDLDAYMRNSPLFSIQQMETPLLVAFGDRDGAVDWHQGIELYNAARRAGKQMVLLVYEGENHSLAQKANQLDYHRRILEWFGHYLNGGPAPDWVSRGMMKPAT